VPPTLLLFTDLQAPLRHARGLLATIARAFDDVVIADRADVAVCVRLKQANDDDAAAICVALRTILGPANVAVLVHDRPQLVGPLQLQGAHLSSSATATDVRHARLKMPAGAVLGLSAHPPPTATSAAPTCVRDDVDYCTWSPVFSPSSKQDARAPLGLSALQGHTTPVVALGGVDVDNAAACLAAGAAGVAVIGAVLGAARPDVALHGLLRACAIPHRRRRGVVAAVGRAA